MTPFASDPEVLMDLEKVLHGWRPTKKDRERLRDNPAVPVLTNRGSLDDQLERTSKLVQDFQSRPVRARKQRHLDLPDVIPALGEPVKTYYWSDKRDPNDPEGDGRQGVWKLFRHEHDLGCGLRVYSPQASPDYAIVPGYEPLLASWPEAIGWLGDWRRVELVLPTDRTVQVAPRDEKWGLYVLPDAQACLAVPYGAFRGRFYVWHGGHLTVTWRGIEG